jgi:integrase
MHDDAVPAIVSSASLTTHELARASAYESEAWGALRGLPALPAAPENVGRYLADCADRGRTIATLRRHAAAIARAHTARELFNPCASAHVRNVLGGIARSGGVAPKKKDALTLDRLRAVLLELDDTLQGARDRALILLGFAGAFRRSELVALDAADLRWETRGVIVTLRPSKTDQEGKGREIGIPALDVVEMCPVRVLRTWLEASGITGGAVFRSFSLRRGARPPQLTTNRIDGRDVARILQRAIAHTSLTGDFAAHSLRAGFITTAAASGVAEIDIARVSGHKSADVLRGYVRRATVLEAPPLTVMIARDETA